MSKLPENLETLRKEHNLQRDDFWQAHGAWCIKHKALERIAQAIGIKWDAPRLIEQDSASAVSMIVFGTLGDVTEWSIGEASPKNNKNAYPWAMAEKRAKDRVILKLVGVAGDVYSEEEADDFKEARPKQKTLPRAEVSALDQGNRTNREVKRDVELLLESVREISGMIEWSDWPNDVFGDGESVSQKIEKLPEDYKENVRAAYKQRRMDLQSAATVAA